MNYTRIIYLAYQNFFLEKVSTGILSAKEKMNKCLDIRGVKNTYGKAFIYLEKAYDKTDRNAMWQKLQVYGVGGKLLKALKNFY